MITGWSSRRDGTNSTNSVDWSSNYAASMLRRSSTAVAAVVVWMALAAGPGAAAPPASSEPATGDRPWTHVATQQCPDSRFECTTLAVPRDHADPDGQQWEITFGLQPAAVESKGTFVTITGGPGTSGLALADSYTDFMAQEITDNFDIVFIDQRGVGDSRPIRCDEAASAYYLSAADPDDPTRSDAMAADAERFVDSCIAESGVATEDLPYYSTVQAVEDLEAIRQYLGEEQLVLYGESYGTQYVQTYAAAHPDRVSMLILDGVVDLTLDVLPYYAEVARAHYDVLEAVLSACSAEQVCAADAGGDALATYDDLAAALDTAPIEYDFPMPDGSAERRTFTANDLELAAAGAVYSLGDRMLLQRAMTAAADGNLVPLARLAYSAVAVDPETLEVVIDPSWSDAAYYAVECLDYEFLPDAGSPRQRVDAWLEQGEADAVDELRLGSIFYGDLPCLYWPAQRTDVPRPAPITDAPYPTLVLNADTDGATPVANAMRVFGRMQNSSLVLLEGGPHVIFDWGYACVDNLVSDAIASGEPPTIRVTICEGDVADPYVAVAPDDASGYDDALAAATVVAEQLTASSDYVYWDGSEPLAVGCDHGGAVEYVPTDVGANVELTVCELTDGVPVTGTGVLDDVEDTVHLELALPDGLLTYDDDGSSATVEGTYHGAPVDERE
jgi:pimeloyl-ACP methyl ester carboxylesterase